MATYTVSGLLLLLAMGLFVPEMGLLFAFATFIFLAFGLSYMSGRASIQVVALTIAVALVLLVTSVALRWKSGVPDELFRWINLVGMLMALSIDATMFVMLRRTLEARANRLVEAERAAAEMQQRLAQQERLESIGQLAGGVAHDFNNLLGVILGFTGFVHQDLAKSADGEDGNRWQRSLQDLDRVEKAANSAKRLTRHLLAFARREIAQPQVIEVVAAVEHVLELLRRSLGEHIAMEVRLDPHTSPVRIDPGHLEQILINLCVNARDAMPGGGILVIETLDVEVDEAYALTQGDLDPGRYVRLRISDTGGGMPEEVLKHAFEPFFTTKAPGHGTGLGLATVYGIVKHSGGRVHLYSEEGHGTTVSVLLPVASASDLSESAAISGAAMPSGQESILVVEDERDLRDAVSRMLESHGYRVLTAPNGRVALEMVERFSGELHLLLTDVVMPEMLGKELAQRVSDLRPGVRVLYMSGFAQPVLGSAGVLGPDMVLLDKPFTESDLLSKVRGVLDVVRTSS